MKRLLPILLFLVVAGGLIWLASRERGGEPGAPPSKGRTELEPAELPDGLKEDRSAEFLVGYAAPDSDPARDLVLVGDVLTVFLYTVKVPDALPTAGNRKIMAALAGDNPYRIRFLDPRSPHLSAEGELLDRWGTPLYFHFVEATDPAIRSAGPDRRLWTDDDVLHGEYAREQNE